MNRKNGILAIIALGAVILAYVQVTGASVGKAHTARNVSKAMNTMRAESLHSASFPQSPIRHLIVICQENHSFDSYFGTYPNAKGFIPLPGTPHVNNIPPGMFNIGTGDKKITPFTFSDTQVKTLDVDHGYYDMIRSYNDGSMNKFVIVSQEYNSHVGNLVMGHYDYRTIPAYWDYAQHFTLADKWFQPIFGPTTPNVLYLVSAQSGTREHPIIKTVPPTKYRLTYSNIGDRLNEKHISWAWYQGGIESGVDYMDNPFRYFLNYRKGLYRGHIRDLRGFPKDLTTHQLPSVCFIKANGEDEHPGTNISRGPQYVTNIINQVMASSYWKDTAIILTYDESGGYWDHVGPPQVHPGPDGLRGNGPRIPTLVISPYAKSNYVSHVDYNTTSILHFIEWNWQIPALNNRDASANNLLDLFQFRKPDDHPFFVGSHHAQVAEGTMPVHLKINTFQSASTGTYAPFEKDGHVYISIMDFARNLNIKLHKTYNGYAFSWNGHFVLVPKKGHDLKVDGAKIDLHANMWTSRRNETFTPLDTFSKPLGFQVKWSSRYDANLIVRG